MKEVKEITYEDWQKNPTPRVMWVWNSNVEDKVKRMVLFLTERNPSHPVIALTSDNIVTANYKHCAEIEEIEKQRRMTHKELAHWLREKPTRKFKYSSSRFIYSFHSYDEDDGDEEVHDDIVIRGDDGEWREPLVEVEE